jgi:hypothetical protein
MCSGEVFGIFLFFYVTPIEPTLHECLFPFFTTILNESRYVVHIMPNICFLVLGFRDKRAKAWSEFIKFLFPSKTTYVTHVYKFDSYD